ncbi:hypothetical protein [Pseudomonas sp. NPDC089569]|uniref:hypothetical protein n=1 Tax=Pseudomonas sp. NPDC089569 TaxID=3390722 RepID=UPI003CFC6941
MKKLLPLSLLLPGPWGDVLHISGPLFPYTQPALFSMPLAFLVACTVSRLYRTARAKG